MHRRILLALAVSVVERTLVSAIPIYPATLANCSMQQKVADLAPAHIGVVWIEREGESMNDIRADFAAIKAAGFTALKQTIFRTSLAVDEDTAWAHIEAVGNAALDAGLIPWWYGLGGWECITLDLLASLGIPATTPMRAVQADPRMLAYQEGVLRT